MMENANIGDEHLETIYFSVCADHDGTTSVYRRKWPPLCLLNCIAILRAHGKEGILVEPDDLHAVPDGSVLILSTGAIDRSMVPSIRLNALYAVCREFASGLKIYITGVHAALFPELLLEKTSVQGCLRGMPEAAVLRYCQTGEWGGCDWRDGAGGIAMETWPVPAFDQVSSSDYHFAPMGWTHFGVFEIGRGCAHDCAFCAKEVYYGKGCSYKSAQQITRELILAIREHGFRSGYFMDICFLSDRGRVEEFCRLFCRERGDFVWACETRVEDLDPEIIDLMYEAGCRMVGFGVCSFHDYLGGRSFDVQRHVEVARMLEKRGIRTLGYFIVSPLFTKSTVYDRKVFRVAKAMPLTFANIRRYLDFDDVSWLQAEILKREPYTQDRVDKAIRRQLLLFYMRPRRCWRIICQVGLKRMFPALWFLIMFLFRR